MLRSAGARLSAQAFDAPFLRPRPANFEPLTPLSLLERAAVIHPDRPAMQFHDAETTWAEQAARCTRLASALRREAGIGRGDTVAVLGPNTPCQLDAVLGVGLAGGVVNSINARLDADVIRYILEHGEAKALVVDREFADVARAALDGLQGPAPLVLDAAPEPQFATDAAPASALDYEDFVASGDDSFAWELPRDEYEAFALNYTSGTTGRPKGVVYHHRGAYLGALGTVQAWEMPHRPVYLSTLPFFHCNAWMMPAVVASQVGTTVMLRHVTAEAIFDSIERHGVTHMCGAPVVMGFMLAEPRALPHRVKMMGAGAPPPAATIRAMRELGVDVQHVFGLTETYGPAAFCAWQPEWAELGEAERAAKQALQGVPYVSLAGMQIGAPEPLPRDGQSDGEIFMRGNLIMSGYLKDEAATEEAFASGWFATGDIGVMHPDNYLQITDRAKDLIISGGENISSLEVESAIHHLDAVLNVAVVAMPDDKWGERPAAFVELHEGAELSEQEVIDHCKAELARFKAPARVVFGPLPKTAAGKVKKFELKEVARGW